MKPKQSLFIPVVAFLGIAILLSSFYIMDVHHAAEKEREKYQSIAANQASIIHGSTDTIMSRVHILGLLVTTNHGDTSFFENVSAQIYNHTAEDTGVALKNIALAPDGVVSKVYPRKGNEGLIGFSLRDPSKPGNAEAISAYQQGKMVLTKPFELMQGGIGMAGRMPVFLTENGKTKFWGLVTVTMDFDELMRSINLKSLTNMGADYRLWYKGDDGKPVVLESSAKAPEKPVSYKFTVQNLTWYLDVAPTSGWIDKVDLTVGFTVIISIALLLALLVLLQERYRYTNKQLQRLAHLDSLTSCFSRHYVNSVLVNQRTGHWNDSSVKYSIAVVDIDWFKSINDKFGHDTGDRAILAVAQVLNDNSRQANGDCVIRYGGDEFVILYNDITEERFHSKLQSIIEDTQAIRFHDHPDLRLTVSIGGEYYSGSEDIPYYDMLNRADEKLYLSKENGRNQFTV